MGNINKPLLRSVLKNLRAVPFDRGDYANRMMAPQEMLDFLAMLAGVKPVFLHGRGFDDPRWVQGVVDIADKLGLNIINGPEWDAAPVTNEFPAWFQPGKRDTSVFYITRTRSNAEAVEATIANPPVTMETEAYLLDYPFCCVQSHYVRSEQLKRAYYLMVQRTAGGDVAEMQRLIREDVQIATGTSQEEAMLAEAREFQPAPFTSFIVCPACAADSARPATQTSQRYENLARSVDDGLRAEIAATLKGDGN